MSEHDRKRISELTTEAASAEDDDLLVIDVAGSNETVSLRISTLRSTAFGSAAALDVGTGVGDVVQLEDVGGGTPGLPAVDARQLLYPAGMNEGELTLNETINENEFGHQFGIADTPFFEIAFGDFGGNEYQLRITDVLEQMGISLYDADGVRSFSAFVDGILALNADDVRLISNTILIGAGQTTITFPIAGASLLNVFNESYVNQVDDGALSELDLGNRKLTTLQLSSDITINDIVNALPHTDLILAVEQVGAGGFEINGWPANVIFPSGAPSVAGPTGTKVILRFYYDGNDFYSGFNSLTASEIKTLYESNPDTNEFTDAEKTKLGFLTATSDINLDDLDLRVNFLDQAVVLVGEWSAASLAGGDIESSFSSPDSTPTGLAYDSLTGNLISADGGTDLIYIHDGVSSTVDSSFAAPGTGLGRIAFDPFTGNLLSQDSVTDLIYVHDGITNSILTSFSIPAAVCTGLTVDPVTGNLISSDSSTDTIYVHDGVSDTILTSFPAPSTNVADLSIIDGNLISSDSDTDLIYIHDGISQTILDSFEVPLYPVASIVSGLTYTGQNLLSADLQSDTIYIHSGTLADFPGGGYAQAGWSYIVSQGGTVDGIEFTQGDRIVAIIDNASEDYYSGNWLKLDYTDRVSSVFGRTGAVVAQSGDYNADQISETANNKILTAAERNILNSLDDENYVNFMDDFSVRTLNSDVWNVLNGTEGGQTIANGTGLMSVISGADAAGTMAANGTTAISPRFVIINSPDGTKSIRLKFRVAPNNPNDPVFYVGLKNDDTLNMPFEMDEYDTVSNNTSQGVGFLVDSRSSTLNAWLVARRIVGGVLATPVNSGFAFTNFQYALLEMEIFDDGDTTFYINGSEVGSISGAIAPGIASYISTALFDTNTSGSQYNIDYVRATFNRN